MKRIFVTIILCLLLVSVISAQQSTSFSYQGKLNSSSAPANGTYDFKFELFSILTNGTAIGTVNSNAVQVTSGNFTVQLDFGANAFDGTDRYLEISVKLPSESNFTTLTPRQKISSVPYAIKAIAADIATVAQTANNATNLGGISANNYLLNTGDGSQLVNVNGGFKWNVINSNQQAQPNNGYFINAQINAPIIPNEIAVNLPTNPQIGDVVRVSGNSFWRVTLNTNQFVTRDGNFLISSPWATRAIFAPLGPRTLVCSPDGSKLLVSFNDGFRISSDFGNTWTFRPNSNASSEYITMSSDGTKMASAIWGSRIYTSTDSGATWIARDSARFWSWIAGSADGTKLVAVVENGQIYTSTDSGETWTPRESNRNWLGVTSSADGTKLAATVKGGQIYTSTDSGLTWTPRETNRQWTEIKSTPDGTKLFAFLDTVTTSAASGVYISNDFGVSWTFRSFGLTAGTFRNQFFPQVAVSDDGKQIAVTSSNSMTIGANTGNSVFSSDFGQTWTIGPTASLRSPVGSSDLKIMYAISNSNLVVPSTIDSTRVGSLGSVTGSAGSSVELLYIGNGEFSIINSKGTIRFF